MEVATHQTRTWAYGQDRKHTAVDRLGVWLGAREVRRHARFENAGFADLGCGFNATFARSQLDAASRALLTDIALAEDLKHHPKVTAVEGVLPEVLPSLEDRSFDVALCLSVLEHLWDPQDALGHIHRILSPGGVAIVNVPSWRGKRFLELSAFRFGTSPPEEMDDHKAYYDPRDLWPLLVRAGFRPSLIRCHRYKFGLNTSAVCRREREENAE